MLDQPLTPQEAEKVRAWIETAFGKTYYYPTFEGKTADYVALVLRTEGETHIRAMDVLKAAGRIE